MSDIKRHLSEFFYDFKLFDFNQFEQDPDDNDGFDIKDAEKIGNTTKQEAAVQIANAIMGAGILALPIVLKKLGILLGSFIIILNAYLTCYSVKTLLRCKNLTKK